MIRFKQAAAVDVPAPPAGYATLFVDAATGLPAAKGSDGIVVPLKGDPGDPGQDGDDGVGIPAGGTLGQLMAMGEGGASWVDPPAGALPAGGSVGQVVTRTAEGVEWAEVAGAEPQGEWVALPLVAVDGEEPPPAFPVDGDPSHGIAFEYETLAATPQCATRLRITVDLLIDAPAPQFPEGSFALVALWRFSPEFGGYGTESFSAVPVSIGSSSIVAELPIPDMLISPLVPRLMLGLVQTQSSEYSAFARVTAMSCDLLVHEVPLDIETTPLPMTPIVIQGARNDGAGGGHIPRAGPLAAASAIALVGIYDRNADALEGSENLYAPRWLDPAEYMEFTPPVEIPIGAEGSGFEGQWGWVGGEAPAALPAGMFLGMLSVDGAPAVLALLHNHAGV